MDRNQGLSNQQDNTANKSKSNAGTGSKKALVYSVIGIIIIIAVVIVLLLPGGSPKTTTTTQTTTPTTVSTIASVNHISIYLNKTQMQELLGSTPSNYSKYTISDPSNPVNITYLEELAPSLSSNVIGGWTTRATTQTAALEYTVIATNSTAKIAGLLGQAEGKIITSSFGMKEVSTSSGTKNGLEYTYAAYNNSIGGTSQFLYGYEGNDVVLVMVTGIVVNENLLINITANYTS